MCQFYETLARYTISVLPAEGADKRELRDSASSAQQFGCMALVKMGVADERSYGCELLYAPEEAPMRVAGESLWLPDAAHVMLALAEQFGDLHFDKPRRLAAKGAIAGFKIVTKPTSETDEEAQEAANIFKARHPELFAAAEETMRLAQRKAERMVAIPAIYEGAAAGKCSPQVLEALRMIGWIAAVRWTAASEIGLWRVGAVAGFEQTAQFEGAVEKCVADLPEDVLEAVTRIHDGPDEAAVEAGAVRIRTSFENRRGRGKATPGDEDLRERAVDSWRRKAEWDLDHSFFARWRMQTGWDNDEKLLPLFHDPVAQAMRRAVLGAVLE